MGAAAVSGARATARPDPEPQPRHAARLSSASGLRAGLSRGLPALGSRRASLFPPLPLASERSPSQAAAGVRLELAPETRRGWELLLAHGAVGAIEPTWRLESRVHRSVPGRDSPQPTAQDSSLHFKQGGFVLFYVF